METLKTFCFNYCFLLACLLFFPSLLCGESLFKQVKFEAKDQRFFYCDIVLRIEDSAEDEVVERLFKNHLQRFPEFFDNLRDLNAIDEFNQYFQIFYRDLELNGIESTAFTVQMYNFSIPASYREVLLLRQSIAEANRDRVKKQIVDTSLKLGLDEEDRLVFVDEQISLMEERMGHGEKDASTLNLLDFNEHFRIVFVFNKI